MKTLILFVIGLVVVGCGPGSSIHEAAEERNIKRVKQLLVEGVDANGALGWQEKRRQISLYRTRLRLTNHRQKDDHCYSPCAITGFVELFLVFNRLVERYLQ